MKGMRSRLLIIHNPMSGRAHGRRLESVCAELRRAGARVETTAPQRFTEVPDVAARASASGTYDAIVAAGGDGTIRAVAAGLTGGIVPLGVIPLGTGNVLASELHLPKDANGIADMLLHGPEEVVSCGVANGTPFLLMAGAGFDAAVLCRLDQRVKRIVGKLAYAGPILSELTHRPRFFEASIDGQTYRCSWLILANACHYAGSFLLASGRDLAAPGLHAVVVTAPTRMRLLRVLLAIAAGRAAEARDVEIIPCQQARIDSSQNVPLQIDGDVLDGGELIVGPAKPALRLLKPRPEHFRTQR
jgi:diacylglycerol kinase (ATP)